VPAVSNRVEIVVLLRPVGGSAGSSTARDWLVRASTVRTNDAFLHVSLTEAAAAATQEGDTRVCMAALDHLEAHFEVPDVAARRVEALKAIERTAGSRPEALPGIIDGYLRLALASAGRDRLEDAEAAMAGAAAMLARSRDKTLAETAAWVGRKVQIARRIADLSAALNRNASDAAANLALGRLHCFDRRDWSAGLPFLSRSGHATLQGLAQRDLAAGRSGKPADLRSAADAWWDAAATEKEKDVRSAMQMHAEDLYVRVVRELSDADRRKVEARIQSAKDTDTRRLVPERQPELRRLMAWANNLPDVALTISVSNRVDLPPSVAVKTLEPLADWTVEALFADATPIRSLDPIRGLPLHTLSISQTLVSDLAPVRSMRLKILNVSTSPITDLSPIEGLGIEALAFVGCPVTSLAPLRGLPIKHLNMGAVPVTDAALDVIAGLPVEELYLGSTPITTLAPLRDLRLRILAIDGTTISDLSPLIGMPLGALSMTLCPNIHDYTPLSRCAVLKAIAVDPTLGPDLRSALSKIEIETINGQPAATVLGAKPGGKR
jgi:hypothetical protein